MTKTRLEAFSDGVIAIIITIMVLELKVPHGYEWSDLKHIYPIFLSYVLSFVFIGIYWGNHHHLVYTMIRVNSKIIWANLHLLFWLSLIPFSTAFMGENPEGDLPYAIYGINLVLCGIAYTILQKTIMSHHTAATPLAEALKKQEKKGLISVTLYIFSIAFAYINHYVSMVLIASVAIMWVIPDKNIERALESNPPE
jgi:uncharacterized membrane protein